MGRDVVESVRYFSERKQIFKVHYRNVDKPLPHFVETFIDNGYMDLYQVTKALEETEFRGVMIPDHVPNMEGERSATAYSIAYIKAHVDRARAEV
jgi:mannonate dehydratase